MISRDLKRKIRGKAASAEPAVAKQLTKTPTKNVGRNSASLGGQAAADRGPQLAATAAVARMDGHLISDVDTLSLSLRRKERR